MARLHDGSRILLSGVAAVLLALLPARAAGVSGVCGPDGRILDRTDLLARLDATAVIEDFETLDLPDGVADAGTACVDDTAIFSGQGPGLVRPGAIYCDSLGGRICWNGDFYYGRTTQTIEACDHPTLTITYTQPVTAMGFDLSAFSGFPYTGTATVYDTANAAVGTVDFTLTTGGPERVFVGWAHAAGIGRVDIYSPTYVWSPKIDDHAFGACGVGVPFCYGDGMAAPCPCGNSGALHKGCENSANTGGAFLSATGSGSIAADSIVLTSTGELPNALTIFFTGPTRLSYASFGDGLRCAGGVLDRLYVKTAVDGFARAPVGGDPSITARTAALGSPIQQGETRYYQAYYRDPAETFCPERRFNVSSGILIRWDP